MERVVSSFYETVGIVRENAAVGVDEVVNECCATVQQLGGTVLRVENWGLKELAYKIDKNQRGFYFMIQFAAPPTAIKDLDRLYKIREPILRFINVRIAKISDELSSMAQVGGVVGA